ncbi:MAG: 3-hydroxy-3-methylglutaryl-coenzyme A reductase [Calditrichaeota bacterium]|nr:3-hydroxy-3-methylglutaryl-coenzyme A reductase [Calditrichota bacterium]
MVDNSELFRGGRNGITRPAAPSRPVAQKQESVSSRIPGFYRLPVERRLAFLQRSFGLSDKQIGALREGRTLRIEHAVNMVENAIGVHGMPLGVALNFLVDRRDYLVPMAIEEASIIAAASKAALTIRKGGGFTTEVDDPVMIGQVQVLELADADAAREKVLREKHAILRQANLVSPKMVARGGGAIDIEARVVDGGGDTGRMLIVHLLIDVREAMGANHVNTSCEAVGPLIERISGGRVHLRILSNFADRRLARATFSLPFAQLASDGFTGEDVARRMVDAYRMAWADAYRATTHNKGIFNGIGAAAMALGQDWRAIDAGGHAWAARDGHYRSLTRYWIEDGALHGSIELPMQVGAVGGALNSHPGVRLLREVAGVSSAREIAGLFAAVGLAQNFAACNALSTVGIQEGHMALHARSVAISVGVPPDKVEQVAQEMIGRGQVKVAVAEEIFNRILQHEREMDTESQDGLPIDAWAPGKVVLFGEHATVYNYPGITCAINVGLRIRVTRDADGPRFVSPRFNQPFGAPESDRDIRMFTRAVDQALDIYALQRDPIAVEIDSDLVPGMGLGSSAAFSAALCSALRTYRDGSGEISLARDLFDDVQRLESIFHGHPSGMDAATVISDGVLWFRKGPPREIVPIHMPHPMYGLICFVSPGARTIDMVRNVTQSRDLNPKRVDSLLEQIGELTSDAGIALGTGDNREVGRLMLRNHELLARLGVSTRELDNAIEFLMERGVLGAKLTGSGGGGAVIAIVRPEDQDTLVHELADRFARVYPFTVRSRE